MAEVRIAVLDEQLNAQLAQRPEALDGVNVVWAGTDIDQFRREVPALRPDALIVDLGALAGEPADAAHELMQRSQAALTLVLYSFARREVLRDLTAANTKPLRAPVSLTGLRGILSGLMVRKILAGPQNDEATLAAAEPAEAPKFTPAQLGRLREIESAIECECPSNLADVLTQLVAFENYSAGCSSRNEADRRVHEMLHKETARARAVMEAALTRLLEHEQISI